MTNPVDAPKRRPKLTTEQLNAAMPTFMGMIGWLFASLVLAMFILAVCKYWLGWN